MSDDELQGWQAHWQQGGPDLVDLQRRARRDNLRHRLLAVTEYLAMALLLAGSLSYALWRDQLEVWLWLAALWLLAVPALLFAWWNRRGLWGSGSLDARAHLSLAIRRCERGLLALRVGYGLLAASAGVVLVFAFLVLADLPGARTRMLVWLAALVALHLLVMLLMQRRLRRRLQALNTLSRELQDVSL